MAQVLVRDVEPGVVEKLKVRAQSSGRSLEAELRLILQQAVSGDAQDPLAEVARVRALFAGRSFDESSALVREDRER